MSNSQYVTDIIDRSVFAEPIDWEARKIVLLAQTLAKVSVHEDACIKLEICLCHWCNESVTFEHIKLAEEMLDRLNN